MAQYPNLYNVELTKGPAVVQLQQMFLGDVKANRIGAIVTENGEAVTLGGTCSGTAILSNGGTVSISGTVSGNTCYIDLPSGVYAVEGPVSIFLNNVSGGNTTTLVAAFGNVCKTQTGTVIDPGTIIPSVSALIDAIDAAVASIPADYTALLAAVAPTFSSSTAYTAGRYVWYSGNLYRFTADHAAGTWAGTDAVQVVVTNEIADLKSAFESETQRIRDGVFVNPSPELYNNYLQEKNMTISSGVYTSSTVYTGVIIPIDHTKGASLTVKKTASKKFNVSTSSDYPASGVSVINSMQDDEGTAITIQITAQTNYAFVIYYDSAHDTLSKDQIKNTISAYYGTIDNNETYAEAISETVEQISSYFVRHKSQNLFNKADTVDGKYIDPRDGSVNNNSNQFYSFIPIDGTGTYRFLGNSTLFGTTKVKEIPLFDSNKTYKTYISGTHFGTGTGTLYGVEFTITDSMIASGYEYFTLSQHKDNKDIVMVVKDIEYPGIYVPYFDYIELTGVKVTDISSGKPNPLYMKTALFFGDSICNGSSAGDDKSGYAGRIGTQNSMNWHNYGYNGATITAITGHHCIASDVVSSASSYPTPDFVILEGGTNDADILGDNGIGTYTESDYSGSYDTTTFSGSFETMLYNAVQQWPHAQIGYISAHKMGNGNNRAMRRTYFLRAQELCKKWGIPFIDLWIESKLNRDLSAQYDPNMTGAENIAAHKLYTDGQHLTPDGYALITPQIEWWMCGI